MRYRGTLVRWNDDRGFGFIEAAGRRERLFVHVSAFERGRVRPPLGTQIEFDVERDASGRKRAIRAVFAGETLATRDAQAGSRSGLSVARTSRSRAPLWVGIAILCAMASVAARLAHTSNAPTPLRDRFIDPPPVKYRCDGRMHCNQMTSCAEATWFLHNCAGVQLDGNHDGVPCEQQWCGNQ
jgi:cold shock CspA family protein